MGVQLSGPDLLAKVRQLADMQDTDYVTDLEIYGYLTDAWREANDMLAQSYEDWNISVHDFATEVGKRDYDLPADFIRLRKAFQVRDKDADNEREYPLRRVTWSESDNDVRYDHKPNRFMLRGTVIRLYPQVQAVLDYRIYYTAAPAAITAASTGIELQFGLDRFIVWDAVMRCLIKEKSDPGDARNERERAWALAQKAADNRDASEPRQTQDVLYSSNDWWDWAW